MSRESYTDCSLLDSFKIVLDTFDYEGESDHTAKAFVPEVQHPRKPKTTEHKISVSFAAQL